MRIRAFFTGAILLLLSYSLQAQLITGRAADDKIEGTAMLRYADDNALPQYILLASDNAQPFSEGALWLSKQLDLPEGTSFEVVTDDLDRHGNRHVRLQQYVDGYAVRAGQMVLHGTGSNWDHATGELYAPAPGSAPVLLSSSQAIAIGLDELPAGIYGWETPPAMSDFPAAPLIWVPQQLAFNENSFQLAYAVKIYSVKPLAHKTLYVDAATGNVIAREEHIHTRAENSPATVVPGTAETAYSGTRDIETTLDGQLYILSDDTRGNGIETYNAQTTENYPFINFEDDDNAWNNVNPAQDEVATDAHWGAAAYFDYLLDLGRNSIDNNGETIESHVHYGFQFANAFWDGSRMTYGDGDPASFLPLPLTSVDVVAHEITHGLTERTSGLIYNGESGALNESFSDIFGAILNFHTRPNEATWIIGADITSDGNGIRNMRDPNIHDNPGNYGGAFWTAGGGVHTNSGVQNHWFQLLTDGENSTNEIGLAYNLRAMALDTSAEIAYQSNAFYLTPSADYQDAGFNSVLAAGNLYGNCSQYIYDVYDAWQAVNVIFGFPGVTSATFTLEDDVVCDPNAEVQFNNTSFADNFIWEFGDGTTSTEVSPTHVYGAEGSYSVTLTAFGGSCNNDTVVNVYENAVVVDADNIYCSSFILDSDQTVEECSGVLFDSGGPDGSYQNNEDFTFTIINPGAGSIELTMTFFETEGNFDFVRIYDGPDESSPLIATLDGVNTGDVYTSTGGAVTINFDSDGSVTRPGFEITWGNGQGAGPADATFTADNTTLLINQPVSFDPVSADSEQLTYDFGDGSPLVDGNGTVTHQYQSAGTYTVTAIDNNCVEQDTFSLDLTVTAATTYSIDPLDICDTLLTDEMAIHDITITNTGAVDGYLDIVLPNLTPISEVSAIDYSTSGATTLHVFEDFPATASEITVSFTANGDYDNDGENATIFLEGVELGTVGNGQDGLPGDNYNLMVTVSGADLTSAAADGTLEFTVQNSPDVDVIFGETHTVEVNYAPTPFFDVTNLPATNVLPAGQSVTITVNLDATGLFPATYLEFIEIQTSDATEPTYDFPVKLRVIGTPGAAYDPTFLNFGQVFTNQTSSESFTISSTGTDSLYVTGFTSSNPLFAAASVPTFGIASGQDSTIQVDFLGTPDADLYTGVITVMTNAGNQNINYLIEVVDAPVASVTPDSICVTLNAGETLDTNLVVTNTGLSALAYQISGSSSQSSTVNYVGAGASTNHVFTDLPPLNGAVLQIGIQGDYEQFNESVSLTINGENYGILTDNNLDNVLDIINFSIPAGVGADGTLDITLNNSFQVSGTAATANLHQVTLLVPQPEWLISSEDPTLLSPGATFNYPVTLDATELNGGTYTSTLNFTSNDPQLESKAIPVKLIVIGIPDLAVDRDTLNFGGVQLTTSEILTLRVLNPGSDDLVIESLTIASGQYAADQFNFTVAPDEFLDVNVIFAPSIVGPLNTTLTLSGPTHSLQVPILGTGLAVPEGNLNRDTICVTLLGGESTTEPLQLANFGEGQLAYTTGEGGLGTNALVWFNPGSVNQQSLDNILTVLEDPASLLDVTISSTTNGAEMAELLENTNYLIFPDMGFIPFDVDNEIGGAILPWLQAGGKIISAGNSQSDVLTDMNLINGSFHATIFGDDEINVLEPGHPLLENVQLPLDIEGGFSSVVGVPTNDDNTTLIVNNTFAPNEGLIFTQNNQDGEVVFLGFNYGVLTQNNETVLRNALTYSRVEVPFPVWLTVDNTDGTLEPGATTNINLTFDAGSLPGATYTFPLTYSYNQPTNNLGLIYLKMIVATAPITQFSTTNEISCDGTVNFFDESLQNPDSWEWDFGDGNTSTEQNPVHNYSANGTYTVTLTTCNELGCTTEEKEDFILVDLTNPFCVQTVFEDNESIDLNGCGGIIFSTGFPGNYPNGVSSDIHITSGNGGPLRITVTSFELEFCCDFLRVYDGGDASAPLIGAYNGVDLQPGDELESTGGELFLTFTTDGSVIRPGFEIQWQCSDDVSNVVLGAEQEQGCPATYMFEAFNGLPEYSYDWDFGDGSTATGPGMHPHTYAGTGTYTVSLLVSNDGDEYMTQTNVNVTGLNLPLAIIGPDTVSVDELATFEKDGTDLLNTFDWITSDGVSGSGETFMTSWPAVGTYEVRLDAGSDEVCSAAAIKEVVVVEDVNVRDAESVKALSLFPNPVNQTLYFELETSLVSELQYRVVDVFGRTVVDSQRGLINNGTPVAVAVGQLPPATYALLIFDESGRRLATRRFVKQ